MDYQIYLLKFIISHHFLQKSRYYHAGREGYN